MGMYNEIFMKEALHEAKLALEENEVPVGAVIVKDGEIISKAHNDRENAKNALHHAEILAIDKACKVLGGWRLWQCEMYVTMEPCPMCAGAIVQARIPKVVYGASSPKAGFGGSVINILEMGSLNHRCDVIRGICEEESALLLKDYFKKMRQKK